MTSTAFQYELFRHGKSYHMHASTIKT